MEGISRGSADAQHATNEIDQNGGSSSVDLSTSTQSARDRVFDVPCATEGSSSMSGKSHRPGRSDPDSASTSASVAEESRAREAKLRTRAQLRVRIAAERRHIDGG